jgi:hypothetical protein
MTRPAAPLRRCLPLLAVAALAAGCDGAGPESRADAATRVACTQHADSVYAMQNPGAVYRQDTFVSSTRDTPFAGPPVDTGPSAGLSDLYARNQMVSDCRRGNTSAAPAGPPPAGSAPAGQP